MVTVALACPSRSSWARTCPRRQLEHLSAEPETAGLGEGSHPLNVAEANRCDC
jgi:hypothetical protein